MAACRDQRQSRKTSCVAPSQPPYMKGVRRMSDIHIIKKTTCPSLSNKATLHYNIGQDTDSNIFIRIINNSRGGRFNPNWINVKTMLDLFNDQEKPFSCAALSPLFKGQSNNTPGFLMAILLKERLIVAKENNYELSDDQNIQKYVNDLTKKKTGSRRRNAA